MPDKREGEQPIQDPAAQEVEEGKEKRKADDDVDPREEEGWSQPESSAQKFPER